MVKRIAAITVLILAATVAFAQGVRVDIPLWTSGPSVPVSGGPLPQSLLLANSTVNICVHPATASSCTPITTYTDVTLATPCPTNSPIVQLPGTACVQTTGPRGNLGFWYSGGVVDYFVHSSYGSFGPFTTSGGSTGPAGPAGPTGPAGPPGTGNITSGSLKLGQYPTSAAQQIVPSNFSYDSATGNNLTIPGAVYPQTSRPQLTPVADVTNPTYGAVGDGVHDDAPAARAAVAAIAAAGGGTIYFPKGTYLFTTPASPAVAFVFQQSSHIHIVCDPGAVITTASPVVYTLFNLGYATTSIYNQTGYQANTISYPDSGQITLTTKTDTSHFSVGEPIYILGGPSVESNGDGEINWITGINGSTGVLSLLKPTSKPYTGNNSNVGAPGIVTVIPGAGQFYFDESIEGCNATPGGDFAFFGQVIGGKLLNNKVTVQSSATRGMMLNSAMPMADIEIAGNTYVQTNFGIQLADGWRDIYIHDNTFTSGITGATILNPSEGCINVHIQHNNFYYSIPTGINPGTNQSAITFSTSYRTQIDNNNFYVSNYGPANISGVIFGLSNGSCVDCQFTNNYVRLLGGSGTAVTAAQGTSVTGNRIYTNAHTGVLLPGNNTFVNNLVHMTNDGGANTGLYGVEVFPGASDVTINGNLFISDSGNTSASVYSDTIGSATIIGNTFDGSSTAINIQSGTATPQMASNTCNNVTTVTNCNTVNAVGAAQTFTGQVTMAALATPTMSAPVASLTGGTLADATQFCYRIQARNLSGYSAAATEQCVTTGSGGGTNSVKFTWLPVPGATLYAIYGRTTGAELNMGANQNLSVTSFVDNGSITPSGAIQATMDPPPVDQAGYLGANSSSTTFEAKLTAPSSVGASYVELLPGTGTAGQLVDTANSPTTVSGDVATFSNTTGRLQDSGTLLTAKPGVNTCGTTTTCSNTAQTAPRVVWGTVTLSTGTATVGSFTAFTSTTSFVCTPNDTTTAGGAKITNASTSSITITGGTSDVVNYVCVGN